MQALGSSALSSKGVLQVFLSYLQSLPLDRRDLVLAWEGDEPWVPGGDFVSVPTVFPQSGSDHWLVLPKSDWEVIGRAWNDVKDQLSAEDAAYAFSTFGTNTVFGNVGPGATAQAEMLFLEWFVPRIRSYGWLWALGGVAAAAFAGGLVYTMRK